MKMWPNGWRAAIFWNDGKHQNMGQLIIMRRWGCHCSAFVVFFVFVTFCCLQVISFVFLFSWLQWCLALIRWGSFIVLKLVGDECKDCSIWGELQLMKHQRLNCWVLAFVYKFSSSWICVCCESLQWGPIRRTVRDKCINSKEC